MNFVAADPKGRRRPNMTPMIDVVFLLLVFFMLASRFGTDHALPLSMAGSGGGYSGPPRLVDVSPDGLALNGVATTPDALIDQLRAMTETGTDTVILRGRDEATLQRLVAILETLSQAGFTRIVLVE